MALMKMLVWFLAVVACGLAAAASPTCLQSPDIYFTADDNNCSAFHVCVMGQKIAAFCPTGNVFDNQTASCVPALSSSDRCSPQRSRESRCPPGAREPVPMRPVLRLRGDLDLLAGARRSAVRVSVPTGVQWQRQVMRAACAGACGAREQPLDICDYEVNQCDGRADCVPCEVRFPSCRGLPDGVNSWRGRQRSPYYVICRQQRVARTGTCSQDRATVTFDLEKSAAWTTRAR